MAGKVLGAGRRPLRLARLDPDASQARDEAGVGTAASRPDDRVLRHQVQVQDRRQHPVDAQHACLRARDSAGRPHRLRRLRMPREGGRRGKRRAPFELLAGTSFEIGGEPEGSAGRLAQLPYQPGDLIRRPAEDEESAGAHLQGLVGPPPGVI